MDTNYNNDTSHMDGGFDGKRFISQLTGCWDICNIHRTGCNHIISFKMVLAETHRVMFEIVKYALILL